MNRKIMVALIVLFIAVPTAGVGANKLDPFAEVGIANPAIWAEYSNDCTSSVSTQYATYTVKQYYLDNSILLVSMEVELLTDPLSFTTHENSTPTEKTVVLASANIFLGDDFVRIFDVSVVIDNRVAIVQGYRVMVDPQMELPVDIRYSIYSMKDWVLIDDESIPVIFTASDNTRACFSTTVHPNTLIDDSVFIDKVDVQVGPFYSLMVADYNVASGDTRDISIVPTNSHGYSLNEFSHTISAREHVWVGSLLSEQINTITISIDEEEHEMDMFGN